ncbi:MAG: pimeloyl-ACP methyl ester esterase BioH [Nitrosospira multiformis]|nr:pimeloyl-ACP methyl ester esterase BioH [Nitrosospira multiformis]
MGQVSLFVESLGEGPDLVLLHGWAMHSGMWGDAPEFLAQYFRVHLIDLPGHGFSQPASLYETGKKNNVGECMAERVIEVLPSGCVICGWSLGGQLAIELALREPARVKKIILTSTTPSFVKRKDWQWGMEELTLKAFAENLKRDFSTTMKRFLTLQVNGGGDAGKVLPEMRRLLFERSVPETEALEAGLQIVLANDLRRKLRNIVQPVLLIHGENDVIACPEAAEWMKQQFQDAELVMLPDCSHVPFLSYPDKFVANIVRFTDELK